uniref:Transposase InsH N-terminal domain-containing protein n=1 Tax=Anaerobacillus isosaccharinicus TaxID=1532552 RepID=A0A7S7L4W5_9BACI|nr:hypothetical protein [Anaerobacillus isosaccharinicus]QOY34487.1 hypothetical protein AWH56_017400 [Anaerobacillus isosaccharinicus]
MDMQLELLPYHYYNTLGFDVELIDYIDHVDDSIVLEKIKPLYKDGGRPPIDLERIFVCIICTLHVLRSRHFRELCRQLKDLESGCVTSSALLMAIKDVPVHSSLTHFRNTVTLYFYKILFNLIGQALKLDDF